MVQNKLNVDLLIYDNIVNSYHSAEYGSFVWPNTLEHNYSSKPSIDQSSKTGEIVFAPVSFVDNLVFVDALASALSIAVFSFDLSQVNEIQFQKFVFTLEVFKSEFGSDGCNICIDRAIKFERKLCMKISELRWFELQFRKKLNLARW